MSESPAVTRHILVTGAASGIGAAVCHRFAAAGCRLTAVDLRAPVLDQLCEDLRVTFDVQVDGVVGDLANAAFAERVVEVAWGRLGPVDVVVTAAGIYPAIPFLEMTAEQWDRVQAINTTSAMQITRALARLAMANARRASVVHISSGAARRARPGAAAYCASKAALEMLTRSAALELGPLGIRVNAVSPGFIDVKSAVNPVTEAYAEALSANPLGRPGQAEDIARAVQWLAGDAAGWITGSVLRVDGGASTGAFSLPPHWSGQTMLQFPPALDPDLPDG